MCSQHKVSMEKTWTCTVSDHSDSVNGNEHSSKQETSVFLEILSSLWCYCNSFSSESRLEGKGSISVTMGTSWKNHHRGQWPKEGNHFFTGRCRRRLDREHQLHRWHGPSNYSSLPTCSIEPAPGSKRPTIPNYSALCIIYLRNSNEPDKSREERCTPS